MLCFFTAGLFWSCWCLPRATKDDWRLLRHWGKPNLQTRSCCKISGKPHPLIRKSHLIMWRVPISLQIIYMLALLCSWEEQMFKRLWCNSTPFSVCDELHLMPTVSCHHCHKPSTALPLPCIDDLSGRWFRILMLVYFLCSPSVCELYENSRNI